MFRLTDALPYLLNRAGVRMGETFTKAVEPYGISLSMYRVLAALRERGDRALGDLAEVTSIEVSTLSRLVGAMVGKGLVSRRRMDQNSRTVEINLTASGRDLVERLVPIAMHIERIGLEGVDASEIVGLKTSLARIHDNLDRLDLQAFASKLLQPVAKSEGASPMASKSRSARRTLPASDGSASAPVVVRERRTPDRRRPR